MCDVGHEASAHDGYRYSVQRVQAGSLFDHLYGLLAHRRHHGVFPRRDRRARKQTRVVALVGKPTHFTMRGGCIPPCRQAHHRYTYPSRLGDHNVIPFRFAHRHVLIRVEFSGPSMPTSPTARGGWGSSGGRGLLLPSRQDLRPVPTPVKQFRDSNFGLAIAQGALRGTIPERRDFPADSTRC